MILVTFSAKLCTKYNRKSAIKTKEDRGTNFPLEGIGKAGKLDNRKVFTEKLWPWGGPWKRCMILPKEENGQTGHCRYKVHEQIMEAFWKHMIHLRISKSVYS